jgi:exodeoxyribonuclease-3
MKIATWNVNSINARMPHLEKCCREAEPDVVCLQETKCVDDSFPYQEIFDMGYHTAFYGQKSYNGVAILSKYEIEDVVKGFPDDEEDSQKRLIAATVNGVRVVKT